MQTSDILVALNGDANNIVPKSGATVPEVLVLMAAHGQHSVTLVPGTIEESRGSSHVAELSRLAAFYGETPAETCFGKPTFSTKLPTTFFEVGLSEVPEVREKEEKETPTERKKRIAAEKAHAALLAGAKVQKTADSDDDPADADPAHEELAD